MENYQFSAEIKQLLNIIINFLYSDKEICIRELISNSSDALEKLKTHNLLNNNSNNNKYEIYITPNTEERTLTIRDFGIGMTRDELIVNLGTIAKSGTRDFVEKFMQNNKKENNMIGQFGIGFYSSFLLGNKVVVKSRSVTSDLVHNWFLDFETSADTFNVELVEDPDFQVGTEITIFIKDGEEKFLDDKLLKEIIKKHSEYTNYPVYLFSTVTEDVKDAKDTKDEDSEDESKNEDADDDQKEKKEKVKKTKSEYLQITTNMPLWRLNPQDITKEQYDQFYDNYCKINNKKNNGYHHVIHFKAEGTLEFTSLIYIPILNKVEPRLDKKTKIQLYIKRVKIIDTDKFLPTYFNFAEGLVDSDDLTVNVSRELLQNDARLKTIGKTVHKKIIDNLLQFSTNEPEKYQTLYEQYSKYFKLGYHEEKNDSLKEKLASLFLFNSLKHLNEKITFDKYISELQQEQKKIYYLSGSSNSTIEKSEFLLGIKKKNYDVLFMSDNIDSFVMMTLKTYKDHPFADISKECQDLTSDISEETINNYKTLCEYMQKKLSNNVSKVVITKRCMNPESVGLIIGSEYGSNAQMEKLQKYQALGESENPLLKFMKRMKTLELNSENMLIQKMCTLYNTNNYDMLDKLITVVYSSALINSGYEFDNSVDEQNPVSEQQIYVNTVLQLLYNNILHDVEKSQVSDVKETNSDNNTNHNDDNNDDNDDTNELYGDSDSDN
ncbi:heat shock protein 90 [Hokovirus HKV1]|uniref:Heat shock protein 90 n=1 Tax=Hokovirus HKV1 TaxID=1977638 RepID=A0A1V0SHA7_9VIRU|nr:heat shock protein 90 [Hokovirus HKV1]